MNIENIPIDLTEKLYWTAVHLRDFIEMQPVSKPVIWCGDSVSKVIDLPHYKKSCEAISLFELYVHGKTTGACEFVDTALQPNNALNFAVAEIAEASNAV